MIRVFLEYEIDNSKQQLFIEVMEKMLEKSKELYPDVDVKYFFKWDKDMIEKVYYFYDFKDENEFNSYFDHHQTDPRWIDFVVKDYHSHNFVTPKTSKLLLVHELGSMPLEIEVGGFDYLYDHETRTKVKAPKL